MGAINTLVEIGLYSFIHKSPHGEILQNTDGSVIITGTWNGTGMEYTIWSKKHEIINSQKQKT